MPAESWSLPVTSPHPAAHGLIRLDLTVRDDRVDSAEVRPGAMHRGAEKLFESRDYRALLALADRHDWLGSFCSELGLGQLLEAMMGIRVSERAAWLRIALAESTRMVHHLHWLAATADYLGAEAEHLHMARGTVQTALEQYAGVRMHLMSVRIGGLHRDCDDEWLASLASASDAADRAASQVDELLAGVDPGLGKLPREAAMSYATSGPVARASGFARDLRLRQVDPHYAELREEGSLRMILDERGDARARLEHLALQVRMSALCIRSTCDQLAQVSGPMAVPLPKSIRVPEGHGYWATENPAGINGWYLVSTGGPTPYRVKLRTSSFANAQAASVALAGTPLDHVPLVMMSLFLTAGDLDK